MVLTPDHIRERIWQSVRETTGEGCTKLDFHAMGTHCAITFASPTPAVAKEFKRATLHWVANFESKYSRFIPSSLVGQINAAAGQDWVAIDAETERLFTLCGELFTLTHGAFDPTALPLLQLWNWKAQPPVVPTAAAIQTTLALTGWDKVQRQPGAIRLPHAGMGLDLGGIGKEYAVDCAVQLALQHGIPNVLVDFGHDVHGRGHPPQRATWHIGLEDPKHPGTCWTGVAACDLAVATSGDYLRRFEINGRRYGHILDPRSGYPVSNDCESVTILAPSCTVAGALSTTAFILGEEAGLRLIESYPQAEGCLITRTTHHETRRFHAYITS